MVFHALSWCWAVPDAHVEDVVSWFGHAALADVRVGFDDDGDDAQFILFEREWLDSAEVAKPFLFHPGWFGGDFEPVGRVRAGEGEAHAEFFGGEDVSDAYAECDGAAAVDVFDGDGDGDALVAGFERGFDLFLGLPVYFALQAFCFAEPVEEEVQGQGKYEDGEDEHDNHADAERDSFAVHGPGLMRVILPSGFW